MNANTLDDPKENENNEIQLAKLKRIITDGTLNPANSEEFKEPGEIANPLEDSSSFGAMQMSNLRGGGNRRGRRNLFDHWFLIRKRRQINKPSKSQLAGKKGNSNRRSNRN